MAEDFEKFKRFDYHLNSNLVIQREGGALNQNEPTGEPESLAGRIKHSMGDKVMRTTFWEEPAHKKRPASSAAKHGSRVAAKRFKSNLKRGATVMDGDIAENYSYYPTTKESKLIYEQVLNDVSGIIGDQPAQVFRDAADEVIVSCRNGNLRDTQKKAQCEGILGPLTSEQFTKLYQLVLALRDFQSEVGVGGAGGSRQEEEKGEDRFDDTTGVAVVFDEEDEQVMVLMDGVER